MKKDNWFKHEKDSFFKDKKKSKSKTKKINKDLSPERVLKTAGSLALVGFGIGVATNLLGDTN